MIWLLLIGGIILFCVAGWTIYMDLKHNATKWYEIKKITAKDDFILLHTKGWGKWKKK